MNVLCKNIYIINLIIIQYIIRVLKQLQKVNNVIAQYNL